MLSFCRYLCCFCCHCILAPRALKSLVTRAILGQGPETGPGEPSTVFFDDYTALVSSLDTSSAEAAFVLLMRILGWKVAVDKDKPFSCLFHSLGIALLLPRSPTDPVQITNTEERKRDLAATCLRLLRNGRVSPHECSVFAGRLRWLEGQTFGRLGRKFFRTVLSAGEPPSDFRRTKLSQALQEAFEWILNNVPKAPPKCFWQPCGKTFQLFTDGSFENGRGCMAGVLCRGSGHPWQYWRAEVPQGLVCRWRQDGVEHPIMQCELLAAAISLSLWGPVISSSFVTLWIDNDAARHSIIAANSYPESNRLIVQACLRAETDFSLRMWVARVPSISNPADAPSCRNLVLSMTLLNSWGLLSRAYAGPQLRSSGSVGQCRMVGSSAIVRGKELYFLLIHRMGCAPVRFSRPSLTGTVRQTA